MSATITTNHSLTSSSSSSSSSHSTPPLHTWNYDVFLSFRGEDTRTNFTDHLYDALNRAGIRTFRDDDELSRGKQISFELLKAIEESRISIIVFSVNYASSRWCLDELVKIIDCKNTIHQLVLPVFYGIDPSDVRKQTGSFAQAFERHEQRFRAEMEKVDKWRAALIEAGNLSGWHLGNGHESKFIKRIVQWVQREVNRTCLFVAKHPVGIDSRVKYIISSLQSIRSNDACMVGIFGMGGMGKTTIAKAVYNEVFRHFEGSCFIANVSDASNQHNGLVNIQEQILSEILLEKNIKVGNTDRGIVVMKERLRSKRVLIVLDDLDELSQVNSLAGQCDWFGSGSTIIITTRDKHLLRQAEVLWMYEANKLNDNESLELFSLHAFKTTTPSDDYLVLSKGIIAYVGGLPLALEVLGCYLFGQTTEEWESAFKKLQQIPHGQIHKKLMISFNRLDNDVKEIFLDIACFFIGMDKEFAINILDGCGFHSKIGISVLTARCLLTVDYGNKLLMHNLVRDMGRAIVHEESPKVPEKRSRLWFHEDASYVLEKNKGTDVIEGVNLVLPMSKEISISPRTFVAMNKLRLLKMNNVQITESFEHISGQLRWLSWHHCPLKRLQPFFNLEKLVVLDMQYSKINSMWTGTKFLKSLKMLNLSHCNYLKETPEFTAPMLEALLLEGCTSLLEVHSSIGTLVRLAHLNLKDCKKLRNLPDSICMLKSLGYLNLTGCANLESLPENLGLLKNLTSLYLDGCNNSEPVNSWFPIISYSWLSPRRTPVSTSFLPASISCLKSLTELSVRKCNLSDGDIPAEIGSLSSLKTLDLGENNFCFLPDGLFRLSKLESLVVDKCLSLQSLPKLPKNIGQVNMNHCTSMERLPNLSMIEKDIKFYLKNCSRLAARYDIVNFVPLWMLEIDCRSNLVKNFMDSLSQLQTEHIGRMGDQKKTCSISFDVPHTTDPKKDYVTLKIHVVYEAKKDGCVLTRICRVRNPHKASQERFLISNLKPVETTL